VVCRPISFLCCFGGGESGGLGERGREGGREEGKAEGWQNWLSFPSFSASVRVLQYLSILDGELQAVDTFFFVFHEILIRLNTMRYGCIHYIQGFLSLISYTYPFRPVFTRAVKVSSVYHHLHSSPLRD